MDDFALIGVRNRLAGHRSCADDLCNWEIGTLVAENAIAAAEELWIDLVDRLIPALLTLQAAMSQASVLDDIEFLLLMRPAKMSSTRGNVMTLADRSTKMRFRKLGPVDQLSNRK
jgi:hypothetical protein